MQPSKSPACHRACRAIHAHVSRLVSSSGIIDRRSAEIKHTRRASLRSSRVFLAQLIIPFSLSSSPLLRPVCNRLHQESAPPVLLHSFSFNTPLLNVIKTHSPLYSMAGDRFRRPVNLLWFLVFELPPNHPCSPHRCSHPILSQ